MKRLLRAYRQHTNANSKPPPSASPCMAATAGFLPSKMTPGVRF